MSDIGETLREARMRRRIDMSEVEAATKVRAKYLRALENEEWDLLPGPTFVKTFLRTYAEYLELDARTLVQEYRQRFERPATSELTPFKPAGLSRQRKRGRRPRRFPLGPALVVLSLVALLLVALYLLGQWGGGSDNSGGPAPTPSATPALARTPTATPTPAAHRAKRRPRLPTHLRVKLLATEPTSVCVQSAAGKAVIDNVTLQAGQATTTPTSTRFYASFGHGGMRLRYNGTSYRIAAGSSPVGYELRPGRTPHKLSERRRASLCT